MHNLPAYERVLFGYSGCLPSSENMHARLTGDSKPTLGVSVSMHGCLSLCGPVQGILRLLSYGSWDRLQLPPRPRIGFNGYRKWRQDGSLVHYSANTETKGDKQPCTLIVIPTVNLESIINLRCTVCAVEGSRSDRREPTQAERPQPRFNGVRRLTTTQSCYP